VSDPNHSDRKRNQKIAENKAARELTGDVRLSAWATGRYGDHDRADRSGDLSEAIGLNAKQDRARSGAVAKLHVHRPIC
jgi:hypothetical protein